MGQDTLGALTAAERRKLLAAVLRRGCKACAFALRFHLHPDVDAERWTWAARRFRWRCGRARSGCSGTTAPRG
jgi:hypothetical protein